MSAQVSCPVFRCPGTSVGQCTGHRRVCERFYCRTHTSGTLCDRCASAKQEELRAEYREMLKSLEREAYTSSLTAGVIALFVFSLLLLPAAFALPGKNTQSGLPIFVISLVGGGAGLLGALGWYVMKAREHMRAGSVELDLHHPGFYDYYRQWQAKIEEITSRSDYLY